MDIDLLADEWRSVAERFRRIANNDCSEADVNAASSSAGRLVYETQSVGLLRNIELPPQRSRSRVSEDDSSLMCAIWLAIVASYPGNPSHVQWEHRESADAEHLAVGSTDLSHWRIRAENYATICDGLSSEVSAHSPVMSVDDFHKTLVDAFSSAAEAANWLAQFNCGWADPNAEAVSRLKVVALAFDRLTGTGNHLDTFARGRIATKGANEAAKIKGPNNEWYASYHGAALGMIRALLNYGALPSFNDAGQVVSYVSLSDPIAAPQDHRIRGRQWFDQVKGEYHAGIETEAAAVLSNSAGHNLLSIYAVNSATDKLASRLRQLGARLEAEFPSDASPIDQNSRHDRARFVNQYAVEAGKALIEAAQDGVFDSVGKALIESASAPYVDKQLRNWEHHVFLRVVQHWLQHRAPGYGGQSMSFPDIALERPGRRLLGLKYARNMRAMADAVQHLNLTSTIDRDEKVALGDIANDALTLRQDLQTSAKRCHKAAGSSTHDIWDAELREYIQIAQRLAVAVAVYLPDLATHLTVLDRDCSRIASNQFSNWNELESELKLIEISALRLLNRSESVALGGGGSGEKIAMSKDDAGFVESPGASKPAAGGTRQRATANERMKAELAVNLETVKGWTIRQWSKHTGFAISTIAECATWKQLTLLRASTRAEKSLDRSRRSKPKQR